MKNMTKKNIMLLILSIALVSTALASTSYALFFKEQKSPLINSYTTGLLDITMAEGATISLNGATPATDTVGAASTPYTITITNTGTLNYKFDIKLLSTTVSNQITSSYIKIKTDTDDIRTLNNLTNGIIKSDITLEPNASITLNLRVWLSISTPNTEIGKVFTAVITTDGEAVNTTIVPQDTSGANAPSIDTAYMVPVYYDSTSSNWKIANKNNNTEENTWYNYTDKQWANMVLVGASASSCTPGTNCLDSVTKHDRDYYTNQSNVGQPVSMDDILAFYVWIPRYKYKVWNINKIPQNNQAYTYNAYNDGIDIQWESGTDSTGNVSCTYYYTAPVADADSPNETCTVTGDTSNPYYTHPAFTFGSDELTGIWVGKFETSSNTHLTGDAYGGGDDTSLTARIVPNVTSWRYIEIGNMFTVLQNMHNASNEYGLPTTKTSVDSHMMKNTEWGAVAYLTNSIYGKCTGSSGGCTEVQINGHWDNSDGGAYYYTYYTTKTGCGPSADGITGSYNTACTEYNTTTGMLASTTGNITGVYDMSGGAWDYVMGNMSSTTGAYTFYPSNTSSTMPVSWYTATTSKYVDTYANGSNNSGQIAYNRSRLGDATGEVNITGTITGNWYSDYAYFVYSSSSWFFRGGGFGNGTYAGPFFFYSFYGGANYYSSFRASLVPLGAA